MKAGVALVGTLSFVYWCCREVHHLKAVVEEFLFKYPDAKNQMIIMVDGNGEHALVCKMWCC